MEKIKEGWETQTHKQLHDLFNERKYEIVQSKKMQKLGRLE